MRAVQCSMHIIPVSLLRINRRHDFSAFFLLARDIIVWSYTCSKNTTIAIAYHTGNFSGSAHLKMREKYYIMHARKFCFCITECL